MGATVGSVKCTVERNLVLWGAGLQQEKMAANRITIMALQIQTPKSFPLWRKHSGSDSLSTTFLTPSSNSYGDKLFPSLSSRRSSFRRRCSLLACLSPASPNQPSVASSTRLYVSGLSFRTTEDKLRNAFKTFGQLLEVNLVMDKIVNRPRGFAFLQYATEEECKKAIEGMHGKFLDGRVIFVEFAKPRSRTSSKGKN